MRAIQDQVHAIQDQERGIQDKECAIEVDKELAIEDIEMVAYEKDTKVNRR